MRYAIAALLALLAGCSSQPTVTYRQIDANTPASLLRNVSDSYYLNTSVIVISPVDMKENAKPATLTYTIASVPREYQGSFKVGIEPTNNWLSTTKVNITKPENTERIATIGTETTENAREMVKSVGGLVSAGIAMAASPAFAAGGPTESCSKPLTAPVSIDLGPALIAQDPDPATYRFNEKAADTACVRIEFGPRPLDARKADSYPFNEKTSAYYYSACRTVVVTVTYPDKRVIRKELKIADPNFIQSVHFPYKGVITMHSECGVSVKTDASADPLYGIGVATELLGQIEAAKKAGQ